MNDPDEWFAGDDIQEGEEESSILTEYDIIAAPNDFNMKTIFDFIESGVVIIPPFQRNFVWDIKRASRLIESIVMGLPIPQIFLYERGRNEFLIIDGQQRLLSIYYFMQQRFPKPTKRTDLRRQLIEKAATPKTLLADNEYFQGFRLNLPNDPNSPRNPLHNLDYETLGEYKSSFDLRTIRNVIVKQTSPAGDMSIYEIFSRLNTGGMNLLPQEIRMCLYHSSFMDMLSRINFNENWRHIVNKENPDLHLRDVEFLLRGLALLIEGKDEYKPSMARFLNAFAKKGMRFDKERNNYLESLLNAFFTACADLSEKAFYGPTAKFTISVFDAVFVASCKTAYEDRTVEVPKLSAQKLERLKSDPEFQEASQSRTTGAGNVRKRIDKAVEYLGE